MVWNTFRLLLAMCGYALLFSVIKGGRNIKILLRLLLPVLLVLAPASVYTQQARSGGSQRGDQFRKKPRIAVLSFQTSNAKVSEIGLSEAITAMAVTELRNNPNYVVIERSQIRAVIDEKTLSQLGLTKNTSDKLAEVLDVEVILLGEVAYLGETIHIDARMVDIRSGRVAVADFEQTNSIGHVRGATAILIKRMLHDYLRPWMGSLGIATNPAGAEVYLDGDYMGTTIRGKPVRVENLIEGRYAVKIILGGYLDWEDEIDVLPKMSQSFNIPLIAKPGSMTISSEPPDAEVFLDNNLVGKTPLTLKEVAEGEHELKIVKETYKEWSRKVVVRSFQPTDVTVSLEVLPAMLVVTSQPSGASVYFMGRERGMTPVTLSNLTPGEVVVRLARMHYEEWVSSFLLAPNERREIDAVMVRQVGLLSVTSRPDSARTYLTLAGEEERQYIGITPIFNYKTTVGEHLLELEKEEYFPGTATIIVEQGQLAEVTRQLKEKPGEVHFTTVPANARVFLDDVFIGRTPLITVVPRGTYSVELHLPFASTGEQVTVLPDRKVFVNHRFRKPRSYVWSSFWASAATFILFLGAGGI